MDVRPVMALALAACAGLAQASYHTFVIEQLYSNADGTVQYVVLHESAGMDGQDMLAGHTLTASQGSIVHTFTFPANLPSAATAGRHVLLGTQALAAQGAKLYGYPPPPSDPPPGPVAGPPGPDFVLPDRFLPTDGATVDYAGVDAVSYASLPTDGATALSRSGTSVPAVATNFGEGSMVLAARPVQAVEFHDAALDHYFISALAPDIDALDSGRIPGWTRTGLGFRVYPTLAASGGSANPVCRFYIPPQHGDSHFFSASPAECAAVAQKVQTDPAYSGFILETDAAFYVALPDTLTGACPAGTQPVYRLFDNRADANHRYTTDPGVKAAMIARGYVAEGYGPDAVIMCAPG